jgi:glycosyltransferase involved in cell wall biosynthesis
METIFISTSIPGRARPDYFFALAESFSRIGFRVIMILDGRSETLPTRENLMFFKWPSPRPTHMKDFIFLKKLIEEYRPSALISSFGSVNIMNICGYFSKVENRINYILSVSEPFYQKVSYGTVLVRKFLKLRKARIYKLATLLVCNSEGTHQDAIEYYGLQHKNFLILHNLIQKSHLEYIPQAQRKRQILIVGNLIKRKGHRCLINQFKNALEFFPNLKLLIVGDGIEKNDLIMQVDSLNIKHRVEFVGSVSHQKVSTYFSESLIGISASIHEAFGFNNIEAMREGTPIISTPTAGALEILKENENGKFFTLHDADSLTGALSRILEDWDAYSKSALNSFNDLYSLDQIDSHREFIKNTFR